MTEIDELWQIHDLLSAKRYDLDGKYDARESMLVFTLAELIKENANLRLCKGIYVEPEDIVFKDMEDINKSFKHNLDELLKNNCYCGIATHDKELILHAFDTIKELNVEKKRYEFQMLLGVTEELRNKIVQRNHRLRVYVPYGKDWYQYAIRRLKENPRMATMVFHKVFGLK